MVTVVTNPHRTIKDLADDCSRLSEQYRHGAIDWDTFQAGMTALDHEARTTPAHILAGMDD